MPNEFDPDAAADELRAADGISHPEHKRAKVAQISAAALVDIAASLQILAAEAWAAMPHVEEPVDVEPVDDATRDFFVVGDLVTVKGDSEPGEVTKVGVDQGEAFADVTFANGHADRYYTRNLELIIGDGTDPELADVIQARAILADVDALPAEADPLTDDLALDDFDDAESPAALDALKALADVEPAPRKKGKKA
jgi:hypothetical protein